MADITHSTLAYGTQLSPTDYIALHMFNVDSGDMEETTTANPNGTGKMFKVKDYAFRFTYAKQLTDRLVVGASLKYIYEAIYNASMDDNSSSADIVDQASSYTEKNVEMRAINRQIKLISKIDGALKKIQNGTYGFCEETGEPIGLKRLMARPVATLCIAAQEKHEKNEKVYADD